MLVGNYGVANLGDEALRTYFLTHIPEVEWVVLSANPDASSNEYPRLPGGVRSFFGTQWLTTIRKLRTCDGVVFGGGSLFTDVESVYACFLWWLHAAVARLLGKPVYLAFQGMGPYTSRAGEWFARWVVKHAAYISVRDDLSYERIKNWEMSTKIVQTADPVFLLLHKEKFSEVTNNVFTIIPRKNSDSAFRQEAIKLYTENNFDCVTICCLHYEDSGEKQYADDLQNELGSIAHIQSVATLDELSKIVSESKLVLSHRYHGALAAVACGIPVIIMSQGQDDKLASLRKVLETSLDAREELTALAKAGEDSLRQLLI
ncbi:MAG: polysaccharide pyruvyl transferase CsaB [Candidatus Peribacteria bacterium]|nr:polysaccharide pyruvyl transferase CsaB [Candidatus Peribacteria bacterium]